MALSRARPEAKTALTERSGTPIALAICGTES